MPVTAAESIKQYNDLIGSEKGTVVLFTASWAEQCKQVENAMDDLSKLLEQQLQFISIVAENFPEISVKHQIEAVPTVIIFKRGTAIDRIDGVDIAALTAKCKKIASTSGGSTGESLNDRLKALINKASIMIFMKGDRNAPRCGFSKQIIAIINETGLPYETFDILSDEDVRQGLKTYSDWPTYPQLYVKGELIGGVDIVKEMKASNELDGVLKG